MKDFLTKILEYYDSYHDAARKNGFNSEQNATKIRQVCKGITSSYNSLIFRDLDKNGNIQILDSVVMDSKEMNIRESSYNRALRYIMDNQDFTISVEDVDTDLGSKVITIRGV